jgi:hypothetical protein
VLVRQPWVMAFNVIQPAIWLLLVGELFRGLPTFPAKEGGVHKTRVSSPVPIP